MKLSKQIREWEKSHSVPIPKESPPAQRLVKKHKPSIHAKELVCGGDILWKPIDRQSAMLLAKAPWWAKPVYETPKPKQNTDEIRAKENRQKVEVTHVSKHSPNSKEKPKMKPETSAEKSDSHLNSEIASEFVKRTDDSIKRADILLERAMDSRAAMDVMAEQWKKSWLDFQTSSAERLNELRQARMAFDSETRQLMCGLREVRQFFLDKDHQVEMNRLREFVELCERLKALKESGFLDTISDTILKLA